MNRWQMETSMMSVKHFNALIFSCAGLNILLCLAFASFLICYSRFGFVFKLIRNQLSSNQEQSTNSSMCTLFRFSKGAHSSTFQSINVCQHTIMYLLMRIDCDDGKNWIELNFFRGVYWLDFIFRCFSLENKLKQTRKKIYILYFAANGMKPADL